ncbi:MAG TPA: hypothetical protein P5571_04300 [Candidatus Krumholzibacteria bacterium]|nr:hypothetical protein [Candidatus Krumholzibacteria bacterium]HRX50561.1 hypothetical protein [Candidatus Krumholzibacteria bacterium]
MVTPADPRDLDRALRGPWRALRLLWLASAALLLAVILAVALLQQAHGRRAAAVAHALDIARPAIAPSGTPTRDPGAVRPGVRPEPVPAAPGVFHPGQGARP